MEWILAAAAEGTCSLKESTAEAAARSGDLGRLRWLRDRGCPMGGQEVLGSTLKYADLAVAQWLVDKGGCRLLQAGWTDLTWALMCFASAKRADCLLKWRWLRDQGATPSPELLQAHLARIAIRSGRLEGLRGLQNFPAMQTAEGRAALQQALHQEEGPRCIAMAMQLQQEGYVLTHKAYISAAWAGDVDMVRFLACEAGVPMGPMGLGELIERWPRDTVSRSRDLLQAVQLLVGGAGHGEVVTKAAVCAAVRRGHLALARYLLLLQLLPGYRPGARLVHAAVTGRCEALLEWLVEQHPGCRAALKQGPFPLYQTALECTEVGMLATLQRLGAPWGGKALVVRAVRMQCELPVLRWLLEQGAPVGGEEALAAALARRVWCCGLSSEDAQMVQRMAERQRHVAAGPTLTATAMNGKSVQRMAARQGRLAAGLTSWEVLWEWLRGCVAAAAASQWWAWLWRLLLRWG